MDVQAFSNELFKKGDYTFSVPIDIDDFEVSLWFELSPGSFEFSIGTDMNTELYEYTEDVTGEITVDVISRCIEKTLEELEHLYFYKKMGCFLSRKNNLELLKYSVFKKFAKKNEECAVCYEETCTKTECRHTCCYKCMVKITRCPVCRTEFDFE